MPNEHRHFSEPLLDKELVQPPSLDEVLSRSEQEHIRKSSQEEGEEFVGSLRGGRGSLERLFDSIN